MIARLLSPRIAQRIREGRDIVILFGARQVGKTTLIRELVNALPYRALSISADEAPYPDAIASRDLGRLRALVDGYELLLIDEAQRIPDIGINLKLLHDAMPALRIVVTGSSSLDLAGKTRESLAGRALTYVLHAISVGEQLQTQNAFELGRQIHQRLIYGCYPRVVEMQGNDARREYLDNLVASVLYKDLLEIARIRYSTKLRDLLRLLALQIGNIVSLNELGTQLGMSHNTVAEYLDLLEQSHIIFRLRGFSRNLRKEVARQPKVYFWDLGVRNALLSNYAPLELRADVGSLWENYAIVERIKHLRYRGSSANTYFWRVAGGQEIDLIEEEDGQLRAYECKWGDAKARLPKAFADAYSGVQLEVLRPDELKALVVS